MSKDTKEEHLFARVLRAFGGYSPGGIVLPITGFGPYVLYLERQTVGKIPGWREAITELKNENAMPGSIGRIIVCDVFPCYVEEHRKNIIKRTLSNEKARIEGYAGCGSPKSIKPWLETYEFYIEAGPEEYCAMWSELVEFAQNKIGNFESKIQRNKPGSKNYKPKETETVQESSP